MTGSNLQPSSDPTPQQLEADFHRAVQLRESGELQESLQLLEAVVANHLKLHGEDYADSQTALSQLGRTLRALGRHDAATSIHSKVLLLRERLYGPSAHFTTNSAEILADSLRMAGDESGAEILTLAREFALLNYPVSFETLCSRLNSRTEAQFKSMDQPARARIRP